MEFLFDHYGDYCFLVRKSGKFFLIVTVGEGQELMGRQTVKQSECVIHALFQTEIQILKRQ